MMNSDRDAQLCDYCGLPLVFLWTRSADEARQGPYYCCLGCRIAAQVTAERGETGQTRGTLARLGIATFFAMNVMVFTLVLWSQDLYHVSDADTTTRLFGELLRYLSLLFTIPVLFLLGQPLVENAWVSISQGRPSTDVLVVVGVLAAFGYSAVSILRGEGHTYFEVTCMVLVFVTFGRWLEAAGRIRAGDAITQLEKLLPVTILKDVAGNFEEVPLDKVQAGDLLKVRAGDRCPVDGQIVEGSASWDEQILTGESSPITKSRGALVYAGALNLDGTILVRATSSAAEGTLSRLVKLVRQAQEQKGPSHRLADRVASWFLPLVAVIAVLTWIWHSSHGRWETGLLAAFAVVLVSCPCSLGLATPLAVWTALSQSAKRQVLFTSGESIEQLAAISAVRLDKTGTLTTGEPQIQRIITLSGTEKSRLLQIARSLADHSTHVFSQAIRRSEFPGDLMELENVRVIAGSGLIATLPDSKSDVALGSRPFLEQHGFSFGAEVDEASRTFESNGVPLTYVGWNGIAQGIFCFEETLRPNASLALEDCQRLGLDVAVLTGDRSARGQTIAKELQVAVIAELLPHQKVEQVQLAQKTIGRVAMVGDGVNDAAALATADVGIALGCGADITRDTAQVCLLGNDLTKLPWAIRLAKETIRTIRWNLVWAYGYNVIGIGLAANGVLNPIAAAGLMVASSLFVITNSLRLKPVEESSADSETSFFPSLEKDGAIDLQTQESVSSPQAVEESERALT